MPNGGLHGETEYRALWEQVRDRMAQDTAAIADLRREINALRASIAQLENENAAPRRVLSKTA